MRYGYILRLASAQVAGNEIKIRKQIKTTEQKGMAVGGWLVVGGRLHHGSSKSRCLGSARVVVAESRDADRKAGDERAGTGSER